MNWGYFNCSVFSLTAKNVVGADAVEFVINHSEVSIAFAEEKKISEVLTKIFQIFFHTYRSSKKNHTHFV